MVWFGLGDYRHFQQYFSYIMTVSFIGGGNEYPEKTTDMWQVTDKLHHKICCIEYTPPWTELELNTLLVIGSDCTCNCKPSYHTIMTTTVPSVIERIRWYVMNEERTGSWLQQTEHIRGHLWRHERGENRIVTTANRTYPWSSVTQTFRNCWPSHVIMVVD